MTKSEAIKLTMEGGKITHPNYLGGVHTYFNENDGKFYTGKGNGSHHVEAAQEFWNNNDDRWTEYRIAEKPSEPEKKNPIEMWDNLLMDAQGISVTEIIIKQNEIIDAINELRSEKTK